MSEPELTPEAKAAIRAYLLKLVLPAGTALSVLLFFVGFFVRDIALVKADHNAFQDAYKNTQPFLFQVITQAEVAKQQALSALAEVEELRASVREVWSDLPIARGGVGDGVPSATSIARELLKDEEFARSLTARAQVPAKLNLRTQLYVRDTQGGSQQTYRCPAGMKMLSCTEVMVPSGDSICSATVGSDGASCTYGFCGVRPGQQYRVTAICGEVVAG